jgi:hypothetical protein
MTPSLVLASVLVLLTTIFDPEAARRRPARPGRIVGPPPVVSVDDDFRNGALGWQAGFADYSPANDQNGSMGLEAGIRPLPPELGVIGTGFYFRGNNHSDDLFMFMKKRLTAADGIRPSQRYEASFHIVLASNAGSECGGIGGAPGQSVYLKTGASAVEPAVFLDTDDHFRMNVDKGNQAEGGPAGSVAGHIGTSSTDCRGDSPFMSIERTHRHPFVVTASDSGDLWLLIGTDSGFEGITRLYYQSIEVTLTPVN